MTMFREDGSYSDGFRSDFDDPTPPLPEDVLKITMPDETTLRGFFSDAGLNYFVEKTNIIELWAGKTRPIRELDLDKELMIDDFQRKRPVGERWIPLVLDSLINSFIDKILEGHPELKAELKRIRESEAKLQGFKAERQHIKDEMEKH